MEGRREKLARADVAILALVIALAFAVRCVVLWQVRDLAVVRTPIGDGRAYLAWAERIRGGAWLGDETFYQAPLYPYLLAVLQALGVEGLFPLRVVHAQLSALACGVLFLAGRLLVGRTAGAVAGVLLALYAPAVFLGLLIQKSALAGLLVCLALWLLARAQDAPRAGRFVLAGATLGALALTREEALGFAPLALAWVAWRFRDRERGVRARWIGALLLGLALPLAPVLARNLAVGGELVLTTSQAGPNFYIGNHAGATGTYTALRAGRGDARNEREDAQRLAEVAAGRPLTPREVSRHWFGKAFAFVRAEPAAWARLLARKARLALHTGELPDTIDQAAFERASPVLAALARVLHMGALLPLAVLGAALTWSRRRDLAFVYAWTLWCAAPPIAFYVFARYRFPLVPGLTLLAAAGLFEGARRVRERRRPRAAAAAALTLAVIVAAWLANGPLPGAQSRRTAERALARASAAAALLERGDHAGAARECEAALAVDPACAGAWSNLALARVRAGDRNGAVRAFGSLVALTPDDPRARKQLGTALAETGDWQGAREHVARSVELWPHDAEAASNLTVILQRLRDWRGLAEHLEARVRVAPEDRGSRALLVWTLATCPDAEVRDGARAVAVAEALCPAGTCDDPDLLDVLAAAYAESGRWDEALRTVDRALERARSTGRASLAATLAERRTTYASGRAWRGR